MWGLVLGLGLLLTTLPEGQTTDHKPEYMFLVPSVLKAGNEQKFCLQLSHLNESLRVTVELEATENVTLLEKHITEPEEYNCFLFQAPEAKKATVGYVTFEAVGDNLHFKKRRSVLIRPLYSLVFLQTDKPIYKPGQTVQFRIVSLDENFRSIHETFPVIYVEDPEGNRLGQWVNVKTKRGIAQESFLLASEPRLGTYKLVAQRKTGAQETHSFSVEEYVLPKYEVQVTMPKIITILDEEVKVTACGKYTYGKSVAGKIDIRVCRKFSYGYSGCPGEETSVCEELSHEVDKQGCFSKVVKTKIFQLRRTGYEMKLIAEAKIKEEGTDVELTGQASAEIKTTITRVSFRQLDSQFKRGIPLYGQMFLEDAAGKPIPNKTVTLFIGYDGKNQTYTTGSDGTADFAVDTAAFQQPSLPLRVSYKTSQHCYSQRSVFPSHQEDLRHVSHYYSRSNSYVKIQPIYQDLECQVVRPITVHYTLTAEGVKDMSQAVFHYLVMSRGAIVSSGKQKIELDDQGSPTPTPADLLEIEGLPGLPIAGVPIQAGQFTFDLYPGVKTAPLTNVLVYLVLASGEVIADSAKFKVKKCFANEAKVAFTEGEVLPGSHVNLILSSRPNSLCAVRAVDSSVLLLKPEAELSTNTVYDLLPHTDLSGYVHDGHFLEEPREEPCIKLDPIFMNGVYYVPTAPNWDTDTYGIMQGLGIKVGTNTNIRVPQLCSQIGSGYVYPSAGMAVGGVARYGEPIAMSSRLVMHSADSYEMHEETFIETVRKYFPETWLWSLVEIDAPGEAVLKLTVPDSITAWNVGMFCTSEEDGFGLAEPVSLVTFQPFFLDLTMPYSAVRGENFMLKATVFNYLTQAIRMEVSLENSEQFTVKNKDAEQDSYCIEANGRMTVKWEVVLNFLGEVNFTVSAQTVAGGSPCGNEIVSTAQGRRDTVTKHMLVEPEGIEKEETHSAMICGKDSVITEKISLKLPSRVVEGSARAYFSAIGDIMGTPMQHVGNLLQMPYGCGEQNLALFAPNIFILEYLNNTNQLTPDLQSKALSYLNTGYQRQLMYKHRDGSYSAFGPQFGQGNTWLTAFTLRAFSRAQAHIYIDPKQISDPLTWLSLRQKQNGCFQSVGQLFNNAMQGGVKDEIALSAYITIALLEIKLPVTNIVVRNALFCLENTLGGENNIYTQTLLAYAFSLAGKSELRSRILHSLDEQAIKDENTIHWHRPESIKAAGDHQLWRRAPSMEVEMTSYALLAILTNPEMSDEDMTKATRVVHWILKQQNPNGGFSSTQDTVVALQGLATYGYHAYKHDGPRDVDVSQDEASIAKLHVEDSNRLLLQRVRLPNIPGDYTVSISGPGCVFIQSTLRYNIPPPEREAPFTITVTTVPNTCTIKSLKMFGISVNVSYIGSRENSNMALVEIKLPSGYIPDKPSVKRLTSQPLIQKAESHPNKVIVYFEKLTKDIQTFTFSIEQEIAVSNLQVANAKIYDYYEPDDYAVTKYSAPCSSKDEVRYA